MDIVILADFCGDLKNTDNNRFVYLANILVEREHSVEIITSNYNHSAKSYMEETHDFPFKVTMLYEPYYAQNISTRRLLAHFRWGKKVASYLKGRAKPDVIYSSIPPLFAAFKAGKYCKKNNIRFVIDIQDLWPEAFQMVYNPPIINSVIYAPFKHLENKIYSMADSICAVSETYVERALMINKKCKKGHTVFLGTNLDTFDNNVKNNKVNDKLDGELWLGYCGTLGYCYDITCVLDALKILGSKAPKFIIMGDGYRRKDLEKHADDLGLNTVFTGWLDYKDMCGILGACDMVVNPITKKSQQSIINKHADYAASGLPVLNTQEGEEYASMVDKYAMGYNCNNNDASDLAEKIEKLVDDEALRKKMGQNARKCAEKLFNRKDSYDELVKEIEFTTTTL